MGWTCLIDKLQQCWEFGRENCPRQEIFYKEEAPVREGASEEIISEHEIRNYLGRRGDLFLSRQRCVQEGLWHLGRKGEDSSSKIWGQILERNWMWSQQRVPMNEWSAVLKEFGFCKKDNPSRFPCKDWGSGRGVIIKALWGLSPNQSLVPWGPSYPSTSPVSQPRATQFRASLALECPLFIPFIPGFCFKFILSTVAR